MHLLMVTDTYHPRFDGIVRYLDYLIPQLLSVGHQVSVVCPSACGEKHYSSPTKGFTIIRTLTTPFRVNEYFFAIPDWRLIKALLQADVVIIHSLMPLGVAASFLAKLFRKKLGFWCHHDERVILQDIIKLPRPIVQVLYQTLRWFYRNFIAVFFCATERFKQKLLSFDAPKDKIVLLPFAINTEKFHPTPTRSIKQKHSLPENAIIATYLGRLSVEKNVATILFALDRALSLVPDMCTLIVGGGPDSEKLIAIPKINADRFLFTGFVPEEELQSYYASSDLFVTPTLNESSCFTVFEAMACRVPIITAAKDHDPEIIHLENALLVGNVRDIDEIADKIILLASNQKLRRFIGFNGQKLILSRTWETHTKRFFSAIEFFCFDSPQKMLHEEPSKTSESKQNSSWPRRVTGL